MQKFMMVCFIATLVVLLAQGNVVKRSASASDASDDCSTCDFSQCAVIAGSMSLPDCCEDCSTSTSQGTTTQGFPS